MQQVITTSSTKNIEIFWGKYLEILSQFGVKESARRWYVKREEAFVRSAQGRKLLDHTADDINHYLEEKGRGMEKNKALPPVTAMEGSWFVVINRAVKSGFQKTKHLIIIRFQGACSV